MMQNSFYKALVAGFGSTLLTLCASSMAADTEYGTVVPAGAKAGDLSLAPCDVYLKGDDREYPGDCGTLVVPENRNNPNSRLIALPVTRINATGDSPLEPIFTFTGGPGNANVYKNSGDGLLERHDLVMVGYRAIEGQVFLECPEIETAIGSVEGGYLSDAALAAYGRGAADCGKRLRTEGIDIDGYSMNQTIEDMETARIALGYERINLYGKSYGTRLEMIYQWLYPESLHRVVMLAVNPPGRFIFDPLVIEQQLGQYAVLCAKDAHCSARTPDLAATMKAVSRNMPSSWMGISIDPDLIRMATFMSLHESMQVPGNPPMNGPAVIDMWLDAAEGDASGMALVSLAMDLMIPKMINWGHMIAMGASAPDLIEPHRDYQAELTAPGTILGSPMSLLQWGIAQGWPASGDQQRYFEAQDSDVETLLISGSIDFSTPPQYARDELLPHLSKGHQVILKDIGHTASFLNSQPQARSRLLSNYFDNGQVDDSLYEYQAPVFDVDKSWGGMAKMALAVIVLVLSAVILLIGRKLRRKFAFRVPAEA